MTARKTHPDFDAAPEEGRWTGTLAKLLETLKHEAYALKGEEAWRMLPGGALIALRILPDSFCKQLRIARRLTKPFTDKSAAAWATERGVFIREFGIEWDCMQGALFTPPDLATQRPGKIEAIYREPAPLGAKPRPKVRCHKCGNEFEEHPGDKVYREPVCTPCAIKAGEQFTTEKRAERGQK